MQIFDEISKVYNERINLDIPSEQARIFSDDKFTKIDRNLLQELHSQGLIDLWITNGFALTDYGIKQTSN